MDTPTEQDALKRAIKEIGNATRLAGQLGISLQAVSQWKQAPPQHVLAIERATGGKVSRYELRPDIFGPSPDLHRHAS